MSLSIPTLTGLNIGLFILVFMRMSGAFIFNPILGRENVPLTLRAAMGLICAFIITPTLTGVTAHINGYVDLIVQSLGELFIGIAIGILISIVIYMVNLAGELIDAQMGLTMAQTYDPRTGVNMPMMGSLFNIIIIFCFFASNAHLTLISFVNDSFRLIAPGTVFPTTQSLQFIVSLGKDYFEFGLRVALPVVAIEVVCNIAMGMLMRAVPSINVFSIGMHLTALVGILIIFVTSTAIVTICGQFISYAIDKTAELIRLLAT